MIDVGHHATTVTPVQDGYPLMMGVRRNLVAGQAMEEFWAERLAAHGTAIRPRYAVRKVVSGLVDANGDRVVDEVRLLGHEGITDSFRRFHEMVRSEVGSGGGSEGRRGRRGREGPTRRGGGSESAVATDTEALT